MLLDKQKVKSLYQRYGFKVENSSDDNIIVCTINNGHYYNADIVVLNDTENSMKVFDEYTNTGYACKIREYDSIYSVEETLFKGFFTVSASKERLKKAYENFTHLLVSKFSEHAKYSYINSKYYINGEEGNKDVVSEIKNKLNANHPILFLIEAAAGFGKTCTAYELLNSIITGSDDVLPLFTELSRNRQAKIFRYVLLDEIDTFFPTLSSKLVRLEIKDGKVPVILDGFDELLHTNIEETNVDINETMIETIGAMLEGKAKVILTTRRTAIFDGDDFHEWMNSHEDDFEIIRIKIDEPSVNHWLSDVRINLLIENSFSINKLSNPVLLSFLRSISDDEFENVAFNPDRVVKKYFELMLDRERTRQDLNMTVDEQYSVFVKLAKDMIDCSYTSESREYLVTCFLEYNSLLLDEVRNRYSNDNRPTKDELANKLASHALLDKSQIDDKGVGFINEFVLGNFCADNIINSHGEFIVDDIRFIAPSVISYIPRTTEQKKSLWNSLKFVLDFIDISEKIKFMINLNNEIIEDISESMIENLTIKNIELGKTNIIKKTLFFGCTMSKVKINALNLEDISFINCNFYDCSVDNYNGSSITLLGCTSDNNFEEALNNVIDDNGETIDFHKECEVFILEKFWPKGRDTFYKHRHIKGLYSGTSNFSHKDILKALARLKRNGFLQEPDKVSFVEINTDMISEIKAYIGKDV